MYYNTVSIKEESISMNIVNIVKAINNQDQYRFIATAVNEDSFEVHGHSLGFQGDELYNKFYCKVTIKDGKFIIDYNSTLFEKDFTNKTIHSSYYSCEVIDRQFSVDDVDMLLQWFTNKNLDEIAFKNHDWMIEIV